MFLNCFCSKEHGASIIGNSSNGGQYLFGFRAILEHAYTFGGKEV